MDQLSHYIRINNDIKTYAEKVKQLGENWKQELFDDITEKGNKLTKLDIVDRQGRPAIGLYGNIFYCEAGLDQYRMDTIFIFRVESADDFRNLPPQNPDEYKAKFIRIEKGEKPYSYLDIVTPIFPSQVSVQPDSSPSITAVSLGKVGLELNSILVKANDKLRYKWFPEFYRDNQKTIEENTGLLFDVWRQFSIERFTTPTVRQRNILNGTLKIQIQSDEFNDFLNLININMLNAFAKQVEYADNIHESNLIKLVERMASLPFSDKLRSRLWASMARKLDKVTIRKEVKEIVSSTKHFSQDNALHWVTACLDACRSVAITTKDSLLLELVEKIEGSTQQILEITQWVETIHFEELKPTKKEQTDSSIANEPQIDQKEKSISSKESTQVPKESSFDLINENAESKTDQKSIESWVIRLRIQDFPNYLEIFLSDLKKASEKIQQTYQSELLLINNVETIFSEIETLQNLLHDRSNQLPDLDSLKTDLRLAKNVFENAKKSIGNDIYILMENAIPVDDVKEIAEILKKKDVIEILPDWVWTIEDSGNEINDKIALQLSNPLLRKRIYTFISKIGEIRLDLLKNIPPPNIDQDIDSYISQIVAQHIELVQKFSHYENIDSEWLFNELKSGIPEHKINDYLNRIAQLNDLVEKELYNQIFSYINAGATYDEKENFLFLIEKSIVFIKESFGNLKFANFELIENWISKNKEKILKGRNKEKSLPLSFSIEHHYVDQPRRRIYLNYITYPHTVGNYGYFTAPILFQSKSKPDDLDLQLSYKVSSAGTIAWPSEYETCGPKTLRISSNQWRRSKDNFIFSFEVKIPTRQPKSNRENVKLSIEAKKQFSDDSVDIKGVITWDHWNKISGEHQNVKVDWPDGIRTKYVVEHPIGPQEHLSYIEDRLTGGSSFALVSPRRFGKTTLALYLQEIGKEWGLIVPPPVLCTNADIRDSGGGINMNRLWGKFSDSLLETLGASLKQVVDEVPKVDCFDHVRRAAKQSGNKGILFVIDEAQLFFPKDAGHTLGDAIKDRLEQEWSRPDNPNLAPIYFGFIGLPDLLEKMGANLSGLLMPRDTRKIHHSRLNQLLYTFTKKSLHTTREARDMLSRKADNLYMLKTLLNEIAKHVNDEKRDWIHHDDVLKIINDFKKDLGDGDRQEISLYLRDIFNDSDDVNFWQPKPCYPLAVALAKELHEEGNDIQTISPKIKQLLNNWCMISGYDSSKRLEYTEIRIKEHLNTLEELEIITSSNDFKNDILGAWLLGQSWNFPKDMKDKEALFAGALKRIRIPDGRERLFDGSQAEIYKFSEGGETYALRAISLEKQEKQQKFHDTIEILNKIKDSSFQNKQGAEFIYKLKDIGIADTPLEKTSTGLIGVEIYHWVDGNSLENKLNSYYAPFVTDIGLKLSRSIDLIHNYNILHRDICPRNIILNSNNNNPVLIDFGLARYGSQEMLTIINSVYTAPEISGKNPKWSKASDIYSLGMTLKNLLAEDQPNSQLEGLINSCINEDPAKRPTAHNIIEQLEGLGATLQIEDIRKNSSKKLFNSVKQDIDLHPWFNSLIHEKVEKIYQSIALGVHEDIFGKCMEVAQILDFTLEGYPSIGESLKLTYVYNKDSEILGTSLKNQSCIGFLGKLRIARNHKDLKLSQEKVLKKFGNPSDEQMIEWAKKGALILQNAMGLKTLSNIVSDIFDLPNSYC